MTPGDLLAFMRTHRVAVQASVSAGASAQAAVVGIAITDRFEVVFDTLGSSRKAANLRANPRHRSGDGRDRLSWPGLTYVRVRPQWIRYSDFGQATPLIVEFTSTELAL